jgi:hypothetical protein
MTPGTQFWMHVILRVCDFFDVVKNRSCKQNSYDDKLVINSKKSQTLSGVSKLDTPIERTLIPLSSTLRALTALPRVQVNRAGGQWTRQRSIRWSAEVRGPAPATSIPAASEWQIALFQCRDFLFVSARKCVWLRRVVGWIYRSRPGPSQLKPCPRFESAL